MKARWYGLLLAGLLGPVSAFADGILVAGGRTGSYQDGGTLVVSGG